MKKAVICAVLTVLCGAVLFAQNFRDGFFFAQDDNFANNQKNQVVIEVKGGKIVSANWNIISLNPAGSQDLKSIAQAGNVAGAVTWAGQAKAVEDFLVSSQNINASSVPGGPSNVKPFFDLVKKALDRRAVAVPKGGYKDGWYIAVEDEADPYHTKNYVLITVVNGSIVDVLWNGILQGNYASPSASKIITSMHNGSRGYPMHNPVDPRRAWHIQSARTSEALVKAQNPDSIKMKPDGKPDAISGVTIEINHFLSASKLALQSAK